MRKEEVIPHLKRIAPELYSKVRRGIASEEELKELDRLVKRLLTIVKEREKGG